MYFPYLRGRQYELLALRELARGKLITSSVIPVIEPTKITSTFIGALNAFQNADLPVALIMNPNVGGLVGGGKATNQLIDILQQHKTTIPTVLLNKSTEAVLLNLQRANIYKENVLTVLDNRDCLNVYSALFDDVSPIHTLCPDERATHRIIRQNKVLFEDRFVRRNRNADYPEDEFFSEDHLFFAEEDYDGFGDYSIIGKEYVEAGFAPYAVAIHIVYLDEDNSLRIKHFISDSNDDTSDVAGKFYEAVTKLYVWYMSGQKRQLTAGLQILLDHYNYRTFPGLPTLKKLSVMHHLELVGRFLDRRLY